MAAQTPADQGEPSTFRFKEPALAVSLDELRKGVEVEIVNDRARPLTARLRLSELGLHAPGAPARRVATARAIEFPAQVDVPAAGSRKVRLTSSQQLDLAAGVAIFTGLEALYVGKAFGGAGDYVAALIWGLTAASAVDLLADALRNRVSGLALGRR